jgi:hypothetical protein
VKDGSYRLLRGVVACELETNSWCCNRKQAANQVCRIMSVCGRSVTSGLDPCNTCNADMSGGSERSLRTCSVDRCGAPSGVGSIWVRDCSEADE